MKSPFKWRHFKGETYIKVKKQWKYLYRAMDCAGRTLEFLLTAKRDAKAAQRFLAKALKATHNTEPRVINVDKNTSYPPAVAELKKEPAYQKRPSYGRANI